MYSSGLLPLIHAKSKTRFSTGKQGNIVCNCLHETELLYGFSIVIYMVELSTVCGALNESVVIQLACVADPWK